MNQISCSFVLFYFCLLLFVRKPNRIKNEQKLFLPFFTSIVLFFPTMYSPFSFYRNHRRYELLPSYSSPMAPPAGTHKIPRITKCSSDGASPRHNSHPRRFSTDRPCLTVSLSHETRRKRSRLIRTRNVQSDSRKSTSELCSDGDLPVVAISKSINTFQATPYQAPYRLSPSPDTIRNREPRRAECSSKGTQCLLVLHDSGESEVKVRGENRKILI